MFEKKTKLDEVSVRYRDSKVSLIRWRSAGEWIGLKEFEMEICTKDCT